MSDATNVSMTTAKQLSSRAQLALDRATDERTKEPSGLPEISFYLRSIAYSLAALARKATEQDDA